MKKTTKNEAVRIQFMLEGKNADYLRALAYAFDMRNSAMCKYLVESVLKNFIDNDFLEKRMRGYVDCEREKRR